MLNRDMLLLFFLYAVSWCVMALAFTATASIGTSLAPNKSLALLPLITHVLGSVIITYPASKIMRIYGRKVGLTMGSILGALGAALCVYGVYIGNFWVIVCSTPFIGMFTGFAEFIKYAASDLFEDKNKKSRAISIIVSSGVISAFLGPWVAGYSNNYFMHIKPYFGPYLSIFIFCFISFVLSIMLSIKTTKLDDEVAKKSVKLGTVFRNRSFIAGTLASALAFLVMAAMMDAMPITMMDHGLDFSHTTQVLQWHLLAMFAPSYLTSKVINYLGPRPVIFIGIVTNVIGVGFAMADTELYNFWVSLFLIGLGWNFMFLAGVSIIATIPDDIRSAAEGASSTILVICFAISAPIASIILFQLGWVYVSLYAFLMLGISVISVCIKLTEQKSLKSEIVHD